MTLIQAPDPVNPKESADTECKTDAKVVAEGRAEEKARKGNIAGSNGNACDCAI